MSDQIGIMRSQIIVEINTYNILLQRQERQERQPQQDQQQQISQVPMHGKLFIEKIFFLWLNLF